MFNISDIYVSDLECSDEETKRKIRLFVFSIILKMLGSPQEKLKFIHVTGTNGKGSTSALTASILQKAGYKVGLFTSPQIGEFTERIQVDFSPISTPDYTRLEATVREACRRLSYSPDIVFVYTAVAFLYFIEMECDIVVLEVNIGGKNDYTNVVLNTEVAVIVNMGLDHTRILGDTIEAITENKAHIIKPRCDVVLYPSFDSVEQVVKVLSKNNYATLHLADFSKLNIKSNRISGQTLDYKEYIDIHLPLLGDYQPKNLAVALEVIFALKNRGWNISDEAIYRGVEELKWPGRMELVCDSPYIIADGAHNPQGIELLFKSLENYFPGATIRVIFGCMRDKDYVSMLHMLKGRAVKVYFVRGVGARPLDVRHLLDIYVGMGGVGVACGTVSEAFDMCYSEMSPDDLIVGTGTFRLIADLKDAVKILQTNKGGCSFD